MRQCTARLMMVTVQGLGDGYVAHNKGYDQVEKMSAPPRRWKKTSV